MDIYYAGEVLSGTSLKKRAELNPMIAACKRGRINKVLTKSQSRFARNTKDRLATPQELMSLSATICFEKESIDAERLTTGRMVNVSSALAQPGQRRGDGTAIY